MELILLGLGSFLALLPLCISDSVRSAPHMLAQHMLGQMQGMVVRNIPRMRQGLGMQNNGR